jgi:hypothetical protein
MDRRHALGPVALAAVIGLAGCSAAGSIAVEAVNDTALADETSRSVATEQRLELGGDHRPWRIAKRAIENGSATVAADREPVDATESWAYRGGYYRLNGTVVGTEPAYRVTIEIDYNGSDPQGTAIDYEELPLADQAAVDALLPQRYPPERPGVDFGVGATYAPVEVNESVLVGGEYDVVVFEGERYRIEVGAPDPVELRRYRYTASKIAANASDYASSLRAAYAFTLTGLDEPARTVFEDAIEDRGYYAESTDDACFESLVEAISAHEAITRGNGHGTWLVRYEDELYLLDLEFASFRAT